MILGADPIHHRLERRIQQLGNQYDHQAADKQYVLDRIVTEPERRRHQDHDHDQFLAECRFMLPRRS